MKIGIGKPNNGSVNHVLGVFSKTQLMQIDPMKDDIISAIKDFKMLDDESGEILEVKLRCSKKINDAMDGISPKESKEVFKKCLKELENKGLVRG